MRIRDAATSSPLHKRGRASAIVGSRYAHSMHFQRRRCEQHRPVETRGVAALLTMRVWQTSILRSRARRGVSKDVAPTLSHRRHKPPFPRRDCVRVRRKILRLENEGAGNAGCPLHPQPCVRVLEKHTSVVTTGPPETPGISLRNGFNGFLRALPGDRAFLPPSPARCESIVAELDASVGASGPHDFAVRKQRARQPRAFASIASRSRRP